MEEEAHLPALLAAGLRGDHRREVGLRRRLELELDAALVLRRDAEHAALRAVVRRAEHEHGGGGREELLHAAVLLQQLVLHQDVLEGGEEEEE